MNKLCRGWNYTTNHAEDDDGRIIIIWKENISLRVLHQSRQAMTCEVKLPGTTPFIYTAIYAFNERLERTVLWVELFNTFQTFALDTVPWMLGGDFNQIVHHSEHSHVAVNSLTASIWWNSRTVSLKWDCLTCAIKDPVFHGLINNQNLPLPKNWTGSSSIAKS